VTSKRPAFWPGVFCWPRAPVVSWLKTLLAVVQEKPRSLDLLHDVAFYARAKAMWNFSENEMPTAPCGQPLCTVWNNYRRLPRIPMRLSNRPPLVEGRHINLFTHEEEQAVELDKAGPFQ